MLYSIDALILEKAEYILNSKTSEECKISEICLREPKTNKLFYGHSYLAEEDKQYFSSFLGFDIAKIRAYISYLNDKIKQLKEARESFKNIIYSENSFYTNYDKQYSQKRINILDDKIKTIKKMKKSYYEAINKKIDDCFTTCKKIDNYFTTHVAIDKN